MKGGQAWAFWLMVGAAIWAAIILLALNVADYFDTTAPRSAPEPTGSPTPIAMTADDSPSALAESAAASAPEQSRAPLIRLPPAAPVPTRASTPAPTAKRATRTVLEGRASWYDDGPGLYAAVHSFRWGDGRYWVTVTAGRRSVRVLVRDHCACYVGTSKERVIDLSPAAFRALAPLSRGIIRNVVVSR